MKSSLLLLRNASAVAVNLEEKEGERKNGCYEYIGHEERGRRSGGKVYSHTLGSPLGGGGGGRGGGGYARWISSRMGGGGGGGGSLKILLRAT